MNTNSVIRATTLAPSAFAVLALACSPGAGTIGSAGDDVTTAESNLAAAQDSLAAARDEARACFEAFRACVAADGADVAACRDSLRACLPERAPEPGQCGPIDMGHGLMHGQHRGGHGGGGRGGHGGGRGFGDCDGGAFVSDAGLPGAGDGASDTDGATDADGTSDTGGGDTDAGTCERPALPGGDLGGCRGAVDDAGDGESADDAEAAHDACVAGHFHDHFATLCEKAATFCAQPNAPADACARIEAACAQLDAP